MVVKPARNINTTDPKFESRVILDGSQTTLLTFIYLSLFESRVILDGSQTRVQRREHAIRFESRVILDGSQTL